MSTDVIVPFSQIERMAAAVAKSGLFGMKTPDQALALMLQAQAEGYHPALAARDFHIIQGRPALKADTMLARFQAAGGKVEWLEYTDNKVVGKFSHPQAGTVTVDWDMARAARVTYYDKDSGKQVPLTQKDVWRQYGRAMLRARVISEGVRTCFPGVAVGVYTVEEAHDILPEKDVTPERPRLAAAVMQATRAKWEHLEGWVAVINAAPDLKELRKVFGEAYEQAVAARDGDAVLELNDAYGQRKLALEAPQEKVT